MKKIDTNKIQHLLIRSANRISDAALTTPTIRAIRKNFPKAQISILTNPRVAPIFENNPHVDEIILFDEKGRHRGIGRFRLSQDLKPKAFDAVIIMQNAGDAAIITLLAGIPIRIGYNSEPGTLLLTHAIANPSDIKEIHRVKYYQGILTGIGLDTDEDNLELLVSRKDQKRVEGILLKNRVKSDTKLVGINPGTSNGKAICWFPERYAQLCKKLQESYGVTVVIVGGPGTQALGKKILNMVGKDCINFCGETTLGETFALIERCNAFFTNDSSLMHIASALDIPQIAIFGSTNHITSAPISSKSYMVRVPMQCSPCLKPDCPKEHHNCMKAVSVDMVMETAEALIKKNCNW